MLIGVIRIKPLLVPSAPETRVEAIDTAFQSYGLAAVCVVVYRCAHWAGLGQRRLDSVAGAIQQRGQLSIGLALLTPGLRNAAVPACGLAGMSMRAFLPPLLAASAADLALHFALGAAGGSLLDVPSA